MGVAEDKAARLAAKKVSGLVDDIARQIDEINYVPREGSELDEYEDVLAEMYPEGLWSLEANLRWLELYERGAGE